MPGPGEDGVGVIVDAGAHGEHCGAVVGGGLHQRDVIEVREILRAWLAGKGQRSVARQAGVDRKTVVRYVEAAVLAGLDRDGGEEQLTDELIGQVVAAVRPDRPNGHGLAWESLEGQRDRIVGGRREAVVRKAGLTGTRSGNGNSGVA